MNVRMPCVFQVQTFMPCMAEEMIRRALRGSTGAGKPTPTPHPKPPKRRVPGWRYRSPALPPVTGCPPQPVCSGQGSLEDLSPRVEMSLSPHSLTMSTHTLTSHRLAMICPVPGLYCGSRQTAKSAPLTHPSQRSSTQHACWAYKLSPRVTGCLKSSLLCHCLILILISELCVRNIRHTFNLKNKTSNKHAPL